MSKKSKKMLVRKIYRDRIVNNYFEINRIKQSLNTLLRLTGLFKFVHTFIARLFSKREMISKKFIMGQGVEIGALNLPLKVFNAKVVYVDRMSVKDLRKHYPTLNNFSLTEVDIVDDGEYLKKIKDESQDFVIANHFIEHSENPIAVLRNHLRVLKPGGVIFWAIPDKRFTFDNVRNLTSIGHVEGDFLRGGKSSRKNHYLEWAKEILGLKGNDALIKAEELMNARYSIHFHVWTNKSFVSLLRFIKKKYKIPFLVLDVVVNMNEFIVILKKTK